MTSTEHVLRIPADLGRLGEVRAFIRASASGAGAAGDAIDDVVQAADEAVTNSIVHGYAGRPGWVEVRVGAVDANLVIVIEDEAPTFDPTRRPEPDMSVSALARGPGGMGVHLIRLATDTQSYRPRAGGGNILTLTRALGARSKEDR